jgi:protein SCO1/2
MAAAGTLWGGVVRGQARNEAPLEVRGVDLVDRAGAALPLDLAFTTSAGEPVTLRALLTPGRPVVLHLVYFNCPMLCSLVLNGYVEAARDLDWVPGREYDVVTVSFDPRDTPEKAAAAKRTHVEALGKEGAASGWHFLVADSAAARALADSVGFGYRWLPDRKEFAHAAGMFVVTPEGILSRTLFGLSPGSRELRYSLVEASAGRLGTPFDRVVLYCLRYDDREHAYVLVARNVMKIGGLLTLAALGILLGALWSRERRGRRRYDERSLVS